MTDIDAALEQEVLNVSQGQREAHLHLHHEPDHLGRRVKVAERISGFAGAGHGGTLAAMLLHR